jgi:DNA polymerase-3 subunit delta
MILKSYIVEQNLDVLNNYQAVLLYGENDGLKEDIKNKLKMHEQGSEIINFFESEIVKKKTILYENIINESLFNENKIIFIQSATDKILNEITESLEKNSKNIKFYIFSDNLDKKSKLRNQFEKGKNIAAFPCYADNERTLINYISKELKNFRGLTGELINIIIANSSLNRKIIQNELVKIKSFFLNKEINKIQLLEILNIRKDISFEEVRDAALIGKKDKTNQLLSEIDILNENSFFYLNNLNYRIFKLIEIQKANKVFNNYEKTLETIKPPIFWKDKPNYLQQLKKWNLGKLNRMANRIGDIENLIKKNTQIKNEIVIKDLLITLSREASISF